MSQLTPLVQQPAAQSMISPTLIWEPARTRHTEGESLRLGKYIVGEWQQDATLPKGTKATYAVICKLPGLKPDLGHCENSRNARALLEKVVKSWITQAGLIFTPIDTADLPGAPYV